MSTADKTMARLGLRRFLDQHSLGDTEILPCEIECRVAEPRHGEYARAARYRHRDVGGR